MLADATDHSEAWQACLGDPAASGAALATERLIASAGLDDDDREIATEGLCGTFALALADALLWRGLSARFVLACEGAPGGGPRFAAGRDGDMDRVLWRHAMVTVEGIPFDAEGRVDRAGVVARYCMAPGGVLVTVGRGQALRAVRASRDGYSRFYRILWRERLLRGDGMVRA